MIKPDIAIDVRSDLSPLRNSCIAKTAEDFNVALADIKKAPKAIQAMAASKARKLGLVFNKPAGLYEDAHVPVS